MSLPRTAVLAAAFAAAVPSHSFAQEDPYRYLGGYGPGSYWGYYLRPNPVAAITDSQGRYLISEGYAKLLREDLLQKKLVTRRQEIEHWVWRRSFLAKADEEEKQRAKALQLKDAADDPPVTEIIAGTTLNTLLKALIKTGPAEPSTPLDQESLDHLNLRSAADRGLGLLYRKDVFWPALLTTARFRESRQEVERLLGDIKGGMGNSRGASPEALLALKREANSLKTRLEQGQREDPGLDVLWTPDSFVAAMRFVRELNQLAVAIETDPNASYYLRRPTARTVGDLVSFMESKGLLFAEALPGDQRHYIAVRNKLAAELRRRPSPEAAP
jgi:hypothetical protein